MPASSQVNKKGMSPKAKTIITVILLLLTLVFPLIGFVGVIVMWFWTTWKKWVKILITIPFVVFFALMIIGATFVVGYAFLFRPYQVAGQAMSPTYNNGTYLMTSPYNAQKMVINRGDVIVFKALTEPEKDFIKRVIALPGETIMLQSGEVIVNGQKLDETGYTQGAQTFAGAFLQEGQSMSIPAGQYFVMGDNRQFSSDSREWGFVPQANIVSKASFCYWNCGKESSSTNRVSEQNILTKEIDTSDWVLFPQQNESYDFTFKYDANKYEQWKAVPYDIAWASKGQNGQDVTDSLMLKCNKSGLQQYSEKTGERNITLGNKDAVYYQVTDSQSGNTYAIVDFVAGIGSCRFYKNISLPGEGEEFDNIISTFRFL